MGSGGGGSAHTPYEAPNTLESAQRLKVVDILCEGPIKTDVSLKNILLDGTPIQNSDSSYNFQGVEVSYLSGNHTQNTLNGFEQVSKVINVGVEVKNATPVTRTITDPLVDSVRVVLTLGSLLNIKDNGDRVGSTVKLLVTAGNKKYPVTIEGKTTSSYNQDVLITDLPKVPFNITVSRLTEDSTTQNISDKTYWNVYVENTDTKFTYPDTVVVGLSIDSAQFGGKVPTRTYLTDWQIVQIPSNYNPQTREYNGVWDGTFKYDWTDNPAWLMFDLITNKRYGLGERVGNACDKWALYEIAKYCDQIVPDGFGGNEPRFTCNVCIDEQRDAYALLDDLASCFRGIPIWDGTQVTFAIDSKKDPVALFSNANVVEGTFEYASSERKTIYTAAHVQYMDRENGYKKTTEYVADDEAIARYGLNVKQFQAFGCTSRGQAARAGKWMIETSIRERQTVTFKTGMQGFCLLPWDIIQVADADYAGDQIHGRIEAINGNQVTIDRELKQNSVGASFHYYNSEGMQRCTIRNINGKILTLNEPPVDAEQFAVFGITKEQIKPRLFRVISIKEDDGVFSVSAIQHDPNKEAIVDNGMTFPHHQQATLHQPILYAPLINKSGDDLVISWQGMNADVYLIRLYRNNVLYKEFKQESPQITFKNLPNGKYRSEIRAISKDGKISEPIIKEWEINYNIQGLLATPELFSIRLDWTNPSLVLNQAVVEIWHSRTENQKSARLVATLPLPTHSYIQNGIKLSETHYFWLRIKDNQGNTGDFVSISGECSTDTSAIVESLSGKITKTELGKSLIDSLQSDIDTAVDAEKKERRTAVAGVISQIQAEARERGNAVRTLQNVDNQQAQQISQITAKADNALAGLSEERTARVNGDQANAEKITAITARVGNTESSILNLRRTVSSIENTVTTDIKQLKSEIITNPNLCPDVDKWSYDNRFKLNSNDWGLRLTTTSKGIIAAESPKIQVQSGKVYTLSYDSAISIKDGFIYLDLIGIDSNGNRSWDSEQYRDESNHDYNNGNKNRQKSKKTFTIPENIHFVIIRFISNNIDGQAGIRRVKFEKGAEITAYTSEADTESIYNSVINVKSETKAVDNKLTATHTLKTQAIAGGRKAIAGIALGSSVDNNTAESSVIVMADKFGVVKNASDGSVKSAFSVVDNRVAINGDLIADGTILGAHIRANQTINAPNIKGGYLNIGNGNFVVDHSGNMTANKGVFKGELRGATGSFSGDISAASGVFKGNIYAKNLVDDTAEPFTLENNKMLYINPFPKKRILLLMPATFLVQSAHASGSGAGSITSIGTVEVKVQKLTKVKNNNIWVDKWVDFSEIKEGKRVVGSGKQEFIYISGFFLIPKNTKIRILYTSKIGGNTGGSISTFNITAVAFC